MEEVKNTIPTSVIDAIQNMPEGTTESINALRKKVSEQDIDPREKEVEVSNQELSDFHDKMEDLRDQKIQEQLARYRAMHTTMVHDEYGKVGRNDLCPCGSGKKYKNCCLGTDKFNKLVEKK